MYRQKWHIKSFHNLQMFQYCIENGENSKTALESLGFTGMISFNIRLKGVNIVKGMITESVSVLKELFRRVPVVEDVQITDQSNQEFTVILKECGTGSVPIHVICLNRAVPSSVKDVVSHSEGQIYRVLMAPYISDASAKICEASSGIRWQLLW